MAEKLCLQWNDFQDNIKIAFENLREDIDFADVTLACEDGEQMEAHKVILAASSPFFKKLLGRNKHPHPLIYLRGIKYADLSAIVEFLYRGEANVFQENLDSFLATAEEFQLKGLMGKADDKVEDFEVEEKPLPSTFSPATNTDTKIRKTSFKGSKIHDPEENRALAISNNFSGDLEELEVRAKSMMEKSQNKTSDGQRFADICKVCGKEGQGRNIKDHIEANHLEGIVIPCNLCNKTFRSRNALRHHNRQNCRIQSNTHL